MLRVVKARRQGPGNPYLHHHGGHPGLAPSQSNRRGLTSLAAEAVLSSALVWVVPMVVTLGLGANHADYTSGKSWRESRRTRQWLGWCNLYSHGGFDELAQIYHSWSGFAQHAQGR